MALAILSNPGAVAQIEMQKTSITAVICEQPGQLPPGIVSRHWVRGWCGCVPLS